MTINNSIADYCDPGYWNIEETVPIGNTSGLESCPSGILTETKNTRRTEYYSCYTGSSIPTYKRNEYSWLCGSKTKASECKAIISQCESEFGTGNCKADEKESLTVPTYDWISDITINVKVVHVKSGNDVLVPETWAGSGVSIVKTCNGPSLGDIEVIDTGFGTINFKCYKVVGILQWCKK